MCHSFKISLIFIGLLSGAFYSVDAMLPHQSVAESLMAQVDLDGIQVFIRRLENKTQEIQEIHNQRADTSRLADISLLSKNSILLHAARNLHEATTIKNHLILTTQLIYIVQMLDNFIQHRNISSLPLTPESEIPSLTPNTSMPPEITLRLNGWNTDIKKIESINEEIIVDLLMQDIDIKIKDTHQLSVEDYLSSISPDYLEELNAKSIQKNKSVFIKKYSAPTVHQALFKRECSMGTHHPAKKRKIAHEARLS